MFMFLNLGDNISDYTSKHAGQKCDSTAVSTVSAVGNSWIFLIHEVPCCVSESNISQKLVRILPICNAGDGLELKGLFSSNVFARFEKAIC